MIKNIKLAQFKKHIYFEQEINNKLVLLHGNNASGKTSILEAISLFSPGSGIFSHNLSDLISFEKTAFEVNLKTIHQMQMTYIKDDAKLIEKKEININKTPKKMIELTEYIRIYGLTPYLAFAFWKDSAIRRKQIDRLIMQNDFRYASLSAKYAKTMRERNKLIETNQFGMHTKNIYDNILIENGLAITEIRKRVLDNLQNNLSDSIREFLGSDLIIEMSPTLEEQQVIFSSRLDPYFVGPHKTKFQISSNEFEGVTASTGQQKKILLALTIAALPESDVPSVLLLDDLFANLDEETIEKLINTLNKQSFQTWISNIEDIKYPEVDMQKIYLE